MFDCITRTYERVPGSVTEGMVGYVQVFGLPHETVSSLRTGPVSPSLESPGQGFSTNLSGQQGPARVTAFSLLTCRLIGGVTDNGRSTWNGCSI